MQKFSWAVYHGLMAVHDAEVMTMVTSQYLGPGGEVLMYERYSHDAGLVVPVVDTLKPGELGLVVSNQRVSNPLSNNPNRGSVICQVLSPRGTLGWVWSHSVRKVAR